MKRTIQVLITILAFSFGTVSQVMGQTTFYWIGGPGDWDDESHWSFTTGGPQIEPTQLPVDFVPTNGKTIPNETVDVVFDANSGLDASTPFDVNLKVDLPETNVKSASLTINNPLATLNLGTPLSVTSDVNIQNGKLVVSAATQIIDVGGNWTVGNAPTAIFESGPGKVLFNGTGSVEIIVPTNIKAFHDLEINKLNGNVNINPESGNPRIGFRIGNDLNIVNGALYDWGNQISNDGSGTTELLSLGAGTSLFIGDDAVNTASSVFPTGFSTNLNLTSTVDYRDRTTPQLISAVPNYGNLNFSNAGGTLRTKSITHPTPASASPLIPLTVRGDILIDNSIKLQDNGYQITGVEGKTFKMTGNSELVIGLNNIPTRFPSNFKDENIDLSPQSTVTYNSSAAQFIKGIVGVGYGNLTLSGNSIKSLDANTIIQGNLTINTNNTLNVSANNHNIQIQGDWTGTGTFTAKNGNPGTNTATVTFNGTANQTIVANNHNFYNVVIDKPSGNITVNSNLTIGQANGTSPNGSIDFKKGLVNIPSTTNSLVLNTNAQSTVGSQASYINGYVTKYGGAANSTFTFPIGNATYYRPAGLIFNNNNSGASYKAKYFQSNPNNASPAMPTTSIKAPLTSVSTYEYWEINETGGTSNASPRVTLSWQIPISGFVSYLGEEYQKDQLVVAAWAPENVWESRTPNLNIPNTVTNSDRENYSGIVRAGGAMANRRTFWTIGGENLALPIELLYFKASLVKNEVQFSWATAKEVNNDYFTVEKSSDGINFDAQLEVDGAGNSQIIRKYSASDANPYIGVTYYRLKQTDFDGKFEYSKTEAVHTKSSIAGMFVYSPDSRQIHISYTLTASQKGMLTVHNSKGVKIWSTSVSGNPGGASQTVNLPVNASGLYVVSLQQDTQVITKKLIVP